MSKSLSVYVDGVTPISCQKACCGQMEKKNRGKEKELAHLKYVKRVNFSAI